MSQQPATLVVLGLEIAFRRDADMERARKVASLVEEKYSAQKMRSQGGQSKDILLTFVALELADELMRMRNRQTQTSQRIDGLLAKIEKSL